jgi:hypothetical protein
MQPLYKARFVTVPGSALALQDGIAAVLQQPRDGRRCLLGDSTLQQLHRQQWVDQGLLTTHVLVVGLAET